MKALLQLLPHLLQPRNRGLRLVHLFFAGLVPFLEAFIIGGQPLLERQEASDALLEHSLPAGEVGKEVASFGVLCVLIVSSRRGINKCIGIVAVFVGGGDGGGGLCVRLMGLLLLVVVFVLSCHGWGCALEGRGGAVCACVEEYCYSYVKKLVMSMMMMMSCT